MIKTTELRRGNLVYDFNQEGPAMYVYQIYTNAVELASDMEGFDDIHCAGSDLVGIPLTEEWLEKKFEFNNREFSFDKGSFFLMKQTGKSGFLYQAHTRRFKVKFVHQLQNLYFFNMEEELIIKS